MGNRMGPLLGATAMRTKLIIITLLALAVGGTCPSDVNSDGTVGITDFLQVLGAWGPCPSAVPG